MTCGCCGKDVVYAGPPWAHFSDEVPVQDAAPPFAMHSVFKLAHRQWVIPMYDGGLILCVDLCLN